MGLINDNTGNRKHNDYYCWSRDTPRSKRNKRHNTYRTK